jgi:enamine deaminase RidA (YjgF/YER057c/UK114 family)
MLMAGTVEARLKALGMEVPDSAAPAGNYVPYVISGSHVFVSGQLPLVGGALHILGKVGDAVTVEEAQECARLCAINIVSVLKAACGGDLDRVRRIVKLGGFVASVPGFIQHPQVINGASDLMVAAFGDAGRHARFAVGVAALPLDAPVEIDAVAEIG